MKKTKRMLGVFLSIVMILSVFFTIPAFAIDPKSKPSDFIVENGVLTEYTGSASHVVIPGNVGITSIGEAVFRHNLTITSVKVPEGVTSIEREAFTNCDFLESVELPSTLKSLGVMAFFECDSLSEIELPDNLTYIGAAAFEFCYSLRSIVIPDGMTDIDGGTFGDCPKLVSLTIPSSVCYLSDAVLKNSFEEEQEPVISNPTVYVEKGSFAESAIKNITNNYVSLDSIEKTSKQRILVTPKELTVMVNGTPLKFAVININNSNYFNIFDIAKILSLPQREFAANIGLFGTVAFGPDLPSTPHDPEFKLKTDGSVLSAMPKTFRFTPSSAPASTGYIVGDCFYMKIRDIANQVDFPVAWDENTKTISLDTSDVWGKIEAEEAYKLNNVFAREEQGVVINSHSQDGDVRIYTVNTDNKDSYSLFNLRDVAAALSNSALRSTVTPATKTFDLNYDDETNTIDILPGKIYTPSGKERIPLVSGKAVPWSSVTTIKLLHNGKETNQVAYNIDGDFFVRMSVLGQIVNFYSESDRDVYIITTRNYGDDLSSYSYSLGY